MGGKSSSDSTALGDRFTACCCADDCAVDAASAGLTGRPSLSPRSREAGDELSRGAVVSRNGPRRRLSMRQGQLADRVNPRTPRPVGDDVAMWCKDERVIWTTRVDDANLGHANDSFSSSHASDETSHSRLQQFAPEFA